ncbi:hypothetical protein GPJ59_36265, partial [Streptomyces bambusae]|nr:hypothetical protein [Streptomyces bambusae]
MTMDSAHAPHPGRNGGVPAAGAASAPAGGPASTTAVRRSVTAIHPPRGPKAEGARVAARPHRVRRHAGIAPLLTADALAAATAAGYVA